MLEKLLTLLGEAAAEWDEQVATVVYPQGSDNTVKIILYSGDTYLVTLDKLEE